MADEIPRGDSRVEGCRISTLGILTRKNRGAGREGSENSANWDFPFCSREGLHGLFRTYLHRAWMGTHLNHHRGLGGIGTPGAACFMWLNALKMLILDPAACSCSLWQALQLHASDPWTTSS